MFVRILKNSKVISLVTSKNYDKKHLQRPGIEPGPPAWQARILPLNQRCLNSTLLRLDQIIWKVGSISKSCYRALFNDGYVDENSHIWWQKWDFGDISSMDTTLASSTVSLSPTSSILRSEKTVRKYFLWKVGLSSDWSKWWKYLSFGISEVII